MAKFGDIMKIRCRRILKNLNTNQIQRLKMGKGRRVGVPNLREGYGRVSIKATRHIQQTGTGDNPREAWDKIAGEIFGYGTSSANKGCPRSAYLGLCEDGLIVGVSRGNYIFARDDKKHNKVYAVHTVHMLRKNPCLADNKPRTLWNKVMHDIGKTGINHNNQMDVVLALWHEGMIVGFP